MYRLHAATKLLPGGARLGVRSLPLNFCQALRDVSISLVLILKVESNDLVYLGESEGREVVRQHFRCVPLVAIEGHDVIEPNPMTRQMDEAISVLSEEFRQVHPAFPGRRLCVQWYVVAGPSASRAFGMTGL